MAAGAFSLGDGSLVAFSLKSSPWTSCGGLAGVSAAAGFAGGCSCAAGASPMPAVWSSAVFPAGSSSPSGSATVSKPFPVMRRGSNISSTVDDPSRSAKYMPRSIGMCSSVRSMSPFKPSAKNTCSGLTPNCANALSALSLRSTKVSTSPRTMRSACSQIGCQMARGTALRMALRRAIEAAAFPVTMIMSSL